MRWFVESNRDSDRDMASSKGIESIAHQTPRNGEKILFFRRGTSCRFGGYTREWSRGSTITVAFLSGKEQRESLKMPDRQRAQETCTRNSSRIPKPASS